jgi:1,3-beta-glucan synthase
LNFAFQVIVLFLLSMVSTGVAYTVATALWGTLQGVTQGVGSIRHWRHIRAGFHRVQAAMRAKLLVSGCVRCNAARRPL